MVVTVTSRILAASLADIVKPSGSDDMIGAFVGHRNPRRLVTNSAGNPNFHSPTVTNTMIAGCHPGIGSLMIGRT
jgi:hypothetical protein